MNRKNKIIYYITLFILALCFACGKEETDVTVKKGEKKAAFNQATSKPVKKFENISSRIASIPKLSFSGVRDPFYTPLLQISTGTKKISQIKGKIQPTQKYEIDKYKLIGIMTHKDGKTAIFEDPEGKGWLVKVGSFIGNEGSKIKKILLDSVIIEEPVMDNLGKVKYVERSISIKKIP